MALRGQSAYVPQEYLDFVYRERFHMTQKELEEEPEDIYNINLSIINLLAKLDNEAIRNQELDAQRSRRG